jgi:hypothetical protein
MTQITLDRFQRENLTDLQAAPRRRPVNATKLHLQGYCESVLWGKLSPTVGTLYASSR